MDQFDERHKFQSKYLYLLCSEGFLRMQELVKWRCLDENMPHTIRLALSNGLQSNAKAYWDNKGNEYVIELSFGLFFLAFNIAAVLPVSGAEGYTVEAQSDIWDKFLNDVADFNIVQSRIHAMDDLIDMKFGDDLPHFAFQYILAGVVFHELAHITSLHIDYLRRYEIKGIAVISELTAFGRAGSPPNRLRLAMEFDADHDSVRAMLDFVENIPRSFTRFHQQSWLNNTSFFLFGMIAFQCSLSGFSLQKPGTFKKTAYPNTFVRLSTIIASFESHLTERGRASDVSAPIINAMKIVTSLSETYPRFRELSDLTNSKVMDEVMKDAQDTIDYLRPDLDRLHEFYKVRRSETPS